LKGVIQHDTIALLLRRIPDDSLLLFKPRWFWAKQVVK
jgi:hypothetical protein